MKRIDLVIEQCKKGNEFYCNDCMIETEEKLRVLLIGQYCPRWFGVNDLSPKGQDCNTSEEQCEICWNGRVL